MYYDKDYPVYLRPTAITPVQDSFVVVVPSTGERVEEKYFTHILTDEQLEKFKAVRNRIKNTDTIGEAMDVLCNYNESVDYKLGKIAHMCMETEENEFFFSIQISLGKDNNEGNELDLLVNLHCPFDYDLTDPKYIVPNCEELANACLITVNAITSIANLCTIEAPDVAPVMKGLLNTLFSMNDKRWNCIEHEMRQGITPMFVARRYGIINAEGLFMEGEVNSPILNEYAELTRLYESIVGEEVC